MTFEELAQKVASRRGSMRFALVPQDKPSGVSLKFDVRPSSSSKHYSYEFRLSQEEIRSSREPIVSYTFQGMVDKLVAEIPDLSS